MGVVEVALHAGKYALVYSQVFTPREELEWREPADTRWLISAVDVFFRGQWTDLTSQPS